MLCIVCRAKRVACSLSLQQHAVFTGMTLQTRRRRCREQLTSLIWASANYLSLAFLRGICAARWSRRR